MERQSLNVFCRVFTYLKSSPDDWWCRRWFINDFKDDSKENLDEEMMTHVLILYLRYFAQTNLAATILLVDQSCHTRQKYVIYILSSYEAGDDYNLYSFLARLPLHIFWRKMMMPGINWDRAFSSSKRVDGDLSRNHSHLHISSTHWLSTWQRPSSCRRWHL